MNSYIVLYMIIDIIFSNNESVNRLVVYIYFK